MIKNIYIFIFCFKSFLRDKNKTSKYTNNYNNDLRENL